MSRKVAEEVVASPQDMLIDAVTLKQQEALESLDAASVAVVAGMTTVQREITGFMSQRVRQDLDTHAAFLRCRSLDDVRRVQADFVQNAMSHYSEELSRILRIGERVVAKSLDRDTF